MSPRQAPEPWQVFIAKSDTLTSEWGGDEKQNRWGKLSLLAVQRCDAWLATSALPKSLQDIYFFLADERLKIARLLEHDVTYGLPRYDDSICSPFTAERLRTKNQFKDMKDKFNRMARHQNTLNYKLTLNNKEKTVFQVILYPDHNKIFATYPKKEIAAEMMEEANKIWLQTLVNKDTLSPENKYFQLGRILWYLALARPLQFGSAGNSEFTYHILAKQLGLPMVAVDCENKTWDVWAMMHPTPDEFAQWFCIVAMRSLKTNPSFELQPFDKEDHTNDIVKEANVLVELALRNSISDVFPQTNTRLIDPYGFGLFHHFVMILLKKKAAGVCTPSQYNYALMLAYQMLPSGQVLFFEALKDTNGTVNPSIFMMNLYGKENEQSMMRKLTNRAVVLRSFMSGRVYKNLTPESVLAMNMGEGDYLLSLTSNPEIHRIAEKCKAAAQAGSVDSVLNTEKVIVLPKLIKDEKNYDDEELMKLVEVTTDDNEDFQALTLDDWLRPRVNGRCLIDNIIQFNVACLLKYVLKSCKNQEDFDRFMDHVAKHYPAKVRFIMRGVVNQYIDTRLFDHLKLWLSRHREINSVTIILNDIKKLHQPIMRILTSLFSDATPEQMLSREGEKPALLCALAVSQNNVQTFAVDFLAKIDKSLTLPLTLTDAQISDLQRYLLSSTNKQVCRTLYQQMTAAHLEKLFTYAHFLHEPEAAKFFCQMLNESAKSTTAQSPTLFITKTHIVELRKAVVSGLERYLASINLPNTALLTAYFMQLDFLNHDDLQTCKRNIINCMQRIRLGSLSNVVTLIDEKIKKLTTGLKK